MKPGQSTTMKPGQSTTLKPGQATTLKPGQSTTLKPGQATTLKPGATTSKKPGASTTLKPGAATTPKGEETGEIMTTTKMPGGVEMVTQVPPKEYEGFAYLGHLDGMNYYISNSDQPLKKIEAVQKCESMTERKKAYNLASLTTGKEFRFVTDKLDKIPAGRNENYYSTLF